MYIIVLCPGTEPLPVAGLVYTSQLRPKSAAKNSDKTSQAVSSLVEEVWGFKILTFLNMRPKTWNRLLYTENIIQVLNY